MRRSCCATCCTPRRSGLTPQGCSCCKTGGRALSAIYALNLSVDAQSVDVNRNLELARAYGLSAYDALYFELSLRRKAALATYDDVMIEAAPSAGIRLYPPVVAARELS